MKNKRLAWLAPLCGLATLGGDCRQAPPDSGETGLPAVELGAPTAMVVDGANARYAFVRLDTGELLHALSLGDVEPELCPQTDEFVCVAYGGTHSVDPDTGDDLLLVIYTRVQILETSYRELGSIAARYRLGAGGGERLWMMDSLDFLSTFPDGSLCAQEAACELPPNSDTPVGNNEIDPQRLCRLSNTHDIEIVQESAGSVTFWVADTGDPSRVLEIALDTSSTCGVVQDAITDELNDDWLRFANTNDMDVVDVDGETMLLVNHKASLPLYDDGNAGRGKSTLWRKDSDTPGDWSMVWEHPAQGQASFLNAPHNSDLVHHPDGSSYLVFAHSNGNGAHFEDQHFDPTSDNYGSVGVGRLDGDALAYLFDGVLPPDNPAGPLNFIRDVDYVPELDAWLVTDSGCNDHIAFPCERPQGPRLLSFSPGDHDPSGLTGQWTATLDQVQQVDLTELQDPFASPFECGFSIPYESDWIWESELGGFLQGRVGEPVGVCG